MHPQSDFRQRLVTKSNDELLDIVEGRDLGYRDDAVLAAQSILRERDVDFVPVSPPELTKRSEQEILVRDTVADLTDQRRTARWLIGVSAPVIFAGLARPTPNVSLLILGGGLLLVGLAMRQSASESAASSDSERDEIAVGYALDSLKDRQWHARGLIAGGGILSVVSAFDLSPVGLFVGLGLLLGGLALRRTLVAKAAALEHEREGLRPAAQRDDLTP